MTDSLPWTIIAENEVDDGEYDWLVPNTPSSVVSLRILAFDPGGNSDTAHVENLSIIVPVVPAPIVSGMYPSNHIAWHEGVFHVIFSQEMDPVSYTHLTLPTKS